MVTEQVKVFLVFLLRIEETRFPGTHGKMTKSVASMCRSCRSCVICRTARGVGRRRQNGKLEARRFARQRFQERYDVGVLFD
jgi:hypothetical protein